jgi:alpha-L-fucosidase
MTDLIDKYHPDLLYTDGHLPFEDIGLKMVAHLYNVSAGLHGGVTEAVYNSKEAIDCAIGTCALDHERGVADGIAPNPWQTDTCIGQWHYKRGQQYKSAKKGHRPAHRYRQQEWQPASQLPAAELRRARF